MELFLSVKIRSDEEIENYNKETFGHEKQELKDVDGYLLIDYIKQSIEMLMNMKMEESQKMKTQNFDPPSRHKSKFGDTKNTKNARRYRDIDEPEINIKMPQSKMKETIHVT